MHNMLALPIDSVEEQIEELCVLVRGCVFHAEIIRVLGTSFGSCISC